MNASLIVAISDLRDAAEALRAVEAKLKRAGVPALAVRAGGLAQAVEMKLSEVRR